MMMRPPPLRNLPIAYRLALGFTLMIIAGMAMVGLIILNNQNQLLERQTNDFATTIAQQMAKTARDHLLANDQLSLQLIVNNLISDPQVRGAAIYADDLTRLAVAGQVPGAEALTPATPGSPLVWHDSGHTDTSLIAFLYPVDFEGITAGYTLISFDHSPLEQAHRDTLETLFITCLGLTLLGVALSFALGKLLSRPIYHLINVSKQISEGNYQVQFSHPRGDEFGTLMRSLDTMRAGLLRKANAENALSRHVSVKVAKSLLDHPSGVQLGGQHVEASVLFADIVGFTSLSEDMAPAEVSALLNEYFGYIAMAARACNGHVDKYMGDCAMLLFGVPEQDTIHSWHAVRCAVLIQKIIREYNLRRQGQGLCTVQFRIGVNSGEMLAGNMGAPERFNYTVVGDAVNLASRLSSIAGPDEIIIAEEIHRMLTSKKLILSQPYGTIPLRGKRNPVTTYSVLDVAANHQPAMQEQMHQLLDIKDSSCVLHDA